MLCEGPLTVDQLEEALFSMKVSTSPGPDGFTVPFYKTFWSELKGLILHALLEMFNKGAMSDNFKESVTILIPKKDQDKRQMDSLRPISLLNVAYKILTKSLARRLDMVMREIIDEDQTGFL